MPTKTRSEILKETVSGVDAFSALRYLKLREETPRIGQLEQTGEKTLPNVSGALLDVYNVLWSPEVNFPDSETPQSLRYWRQTLESAVKTTAYEQMHAQTALQELASIIGTIAMGESVLKLVPKEDAEKLQEMQQAEQQANQAQSDQQQAQSQANALAQAMQQIQAAMGEGQPSKQAAQAMQQMQGQMSQAQAQASQAQMTLAQAQAKAESLAQELMGKPGSQEAAQKQQQMARIAQQAATDAGKEVKEVSEMLQTWGVDPGEITREGVPHAMDLMARIKKSKEFKKFQELLGRMRQIAARKSRSNANKKGRLSYRFTTSQDIMAATDELVNLIHPATRQQTLMKWMRGELMVRKEIWKQVLGKGPIVVCEDGSGSMAGEKKLWSKAVCLALAYYAKLEKRTFVWIHFGSKTSRLVVRVYKNGQISLEQMLEIAETFLSSGTDFEVPLSKALEIIREEGLNKADVTLVTDGECAVSEVWLKAFLAEKKAREVSVFTVLMDVGDSSNATVNQFSDIVETVSRFSAEEAGQKVIAHLA